MIDVQQVSRYYGSFKAVDEISFSVNRGEIVGLLGPNGAGKTTTMRMITGFLGTSEGSIAVGGDPMSTDAKDLKRRIGYMPESAPLYGDMIVEDYLRYVAGVQGLDPETKVPRAAQTCGLIDVMHKNVGELSRGYRQRVGLAHALMHDPEILILDEPTSGLDPNQIIEVRNLIKEIGKTRTVIISTHILSEVEMLCGRVIIISRGKIVADSPTGELRARFGHGAAVSVSVSGPAGAELAAAVRDLPGVAAVSEPSEAEGLVSVVASAEGGAEIRPAIFSLVAKRGWVLYEMVLRQNSLEDVFRNLTSGGEA